VLRSKYVVVGGLGGWVHTPHWHGLPGVSAMGLDDNNKKQMILYYNALAFKTRKHWLALLSLTF
jgi:hypothetical protein